MTAHFLNVSLALTKGETFAEREPGVGTRPQYPAQFGEPLL